jgi:peptidoglycan/xylan/chitin deacetylase (PgdA/CDA1 family)
MKDLSYYQQKKCFPNKHIIILTADDGRRDNRAALLPLLTKYHSIKWTLGIIAGNIRETFETRKDPFMLRAEILQLFETRQIEIASHSLTHGDLSLLSGATLQQELCESKKILEDMFHTSVITMIYPFGKNNLETRKMSAQCGYAR